MDQYKVDFHIHTCFSDGLSKPTEIVKKAKNLDYDMISITDHDGVDGVREAVIAGEALEIKVIPGIELAVETEDGTGLHILGYYMDIENQEFRECLKDLVRRRNERNEKLIGVLNLMGYELSMDDLREQQPNNYIGKLVIARALAAKGYIKAPEEAFIPGQFLGSREARNVKREKLQASEAIGIIKKAGGIAVLAHPIQTKGVGKTGSQEFYDNMDKKIKRLKLQGLKGIECYHPDQNHEETMKFISLAEKYHLHITKGSDFHGSDYDGK